MFDLIIIGFACISIAVFAVAGNDRNQENVQIQSETDTGN